MRANESYRFLCVLSVNHGDRIIGRVEAPFVRVKRLCLSVPSRYARAGSVRGLRSYTTGASGHGRVLF